MGTPFNDIYELFLSQTKSYELALLEDTVLIENMNRWMTGAITHFHTCEKDLYKVDKILATFDEELTDTEKFILANYMVYAYVKTFLIREENLSQALNSKDYRMYSPANQLKALQSLCEDISKEGSTLQSQYSWNSSSLKEAFKR